MNQIFVFSFIILLLGICGPSTQVAENATHPQANNTAGGNANPTDGGTASSNPLGNITPPKNDTAIWQMINKDMVETACLEGAKAQSGGASWAIKGCTCDETVEPDRKTYDCAVALAGGLESPASLDCSLTERECGIASEFGNDTLTFDQIIAFSNR